MEAFAKFVEAIAQLIGVIVWPAVAVFFALRFGQPIREFLTNLGEGSFKVLGVEASGKRRGEALAAVATASVAQIETRAAGGHGPPLSIKEITSSVSQALEAANNLITEDVIKAARGKNILWVDDRPENNFYEKTALEALGFHVWAAKSTEEALQLFRHAKHVDIIISDMRRPEGEKAGSDLLKKLYDSNIYKPYIIYCGHSSPDERAELRKRGAFGVTTNANELLELVLQALKYNSIFD